MKRKLFLRLQTPRKQRSLRRTLTKLLFIYFCIAGIVFSCLMALYFLLPYLPDLPSAPAVEVKMLIHDDFCVLNREIALGIQNKNYAVAQKYIPRLAKWEEKQRQKSDVAYVYRWAESYQSLLYEAQGEYEKSLELQLKWRGRLQVYYEYGPYCGQNSGDLYALPRILYKLNRKEEAFVEYCKATCELQNHSWNMSSLTSPPMQRQEEFLYERIARLITQDAPIWIEGNLFIDFTDFLKFIDEEYARLGKPEEYAEAVKTFHAVDGQLQKQRSNATKNET